MRIPTVRIKDDRAPGGFVVINEDDFDEAVHELHGEAPQKKSDATQSLSDWRSAHWKTQVKLAKSLGCQGEPTTEEARAFLKAKLEGHDQP